MTTVTVGQFLGSLYSTFRDEIFLVPLRCDEEVYFAKNDNNEIFYIVKGAGDGMYKLNNVFYNLDTIDITNAEEEHFTYCCPPECVESWKLEKTLKRTMTKEDYTFDLFVKYFLVTLQYGDEYANDYFKIKYDATRNMYMLGLNLEYNQSQKYKNISDKAKKHNDDPNRLFEIYSLFDKKSDSLFY